MSLPANVLSTINHPAAFLSPIDRIRGLLDDWTLGGIALNDSSQGLQVQAWHLTYSDPVFTVTPELFGSSSDIHSAAGCTEVALAFDANMDFVLAFVQADQAKFRWFNIVVGSHVTTDLEANAVSPRCDLDDSRELQIQVGSPDIIIGYFLDGALVHRRQRDRYDDLYELKTGFTDETLYRVGMNLENRFQFGYLSDAAPPVVPTVTTPTFADVTETTATLGGNVTDDGGGVITERGTVWALTSDPDTGDDKNIVAGTTGAFTGPVTGLPSDTLIHYRAYATNSAGTSYSADDTFTTEAGTGIEFIASSTFVGSSLGTGDVNIDKPVGTLEGDLVVIFNTNRNSLVALPTGGATWIEKFGWTVATSSVSEPVSTNDNSYCWYKTAGASEPSQYTIAFTDQGTDGLCLICATFRNASVVGVYDASDDSDAPSITASEGDTLLSWHGSTFEQSDETGVAAPAGMTLTDKIYAAVADVGLALAYEHDISAGATGAITWITEWTNWSIAGNVVIR